MPLTLLLALVIGGICAIVLILHLTGKSAQTMLTPEDARTAWHRHFPNDVITDVLTARDAHAALVMTGQGPGLLWSFGADTVARHLRDFDLIDRRDGLRIDFHDFTAPQVRLRLDDDERDHWKHMLRPPGWPT